jgi:alpha-tubulin suppressor-like RCC1 family protein
VAVKGLADDIHRISGGGAHTCAITEDGAAKCWGWNFSGQLGNNTTTNSSKPVSVFGLGGD